MLLSGCRLLSAITSDGDCGIDQRGAVARGTVTEGGIDMAYGSISVWDVRGAENRRYVAWNITAFDLQGHITSITLVNTSQRVPALLVIPPTPAGPPFTFVGNLVQESGATTPALEGLLEPVAAGQTAFEITTDLPDRPLLTIPLPLEMAQDWVRATDCY
jgi:hypothetical protein